MKNALAYLVSVADISVYVAIYDRTEPYEMDEKHVLLIRAPYGTSMPMIYHALARNAGMPIMDVRDRMHVMLISDYRIIGEGTSVLQVYLIGDDLCIDERSPEIIVRPKRSNKRRVIL